MNSGVSAYAIYVKFYTGLSNNESLSSSDFFFEGFTGHVQFDEEQTVAAAIAFKDHKENIPMRNKDQLRFAMIQLI